MNTENEKIRESKSGNRQLLFLLRFRRLSLWQHGANLVGNLLVLGLDFVQDGVDLGLVVAVDLKYLTRELYLLKYDKTKADLHNVKEKCFSKLLVSFKSIRCKL